MDNERSTLYQRDSRLLALLFPSHRIMVPLETPLVGRDRHLSDSALPHALPSLCVIAIDLGLYSPQIEQVCLVYGRLFVVCVAPALYYALLAHADAQLHRANLHMLLPEEHQRRSRAA